MQIGPGKLQPHSGLRIEFYHLSLSTQPDGKMISQDPCQGFKNGPHRQSGNQQRRFRVGDKRRSNNKQCWSPHRKPNRVPDRNHALLSKLVMEKDILREINAILGDAVYNPATPDIGEWLRQYRAAASEAHQLATCFALGSRNSAVRYTKCQTKSLDAGAAAATTGGEHRVPQPVGSHWPPRRRQHSSRPESWSRYHHRRSP